MKRYQQATLDFGFNEPEPPVSQQEQGPVTVETPQVQSTAEAPVKVDVVDEDTVLVIRKKPGRKKKEKTWQPSNPGKRGRKSLKEVAREAELIEIPADEELFQKQYYSIGEVANMFRMNPSLIRTWSNEFDSFLQPRKNRKGDRFFRPEDVKQLHLIYHLIRVRKFTLEGAREHLKAQKKKAEQQFAILQSLQKLRAFLVELRANL
ncbi:MerR family transcriptional regulator [Flavihumibacter rivuli]|uniref:MerR family transcriptional regulator n=1 Tax=Flavihumibacter rivuli TaxID=2838156 RepID=UPI001BDEE4D8|nr:MerR family transcriptional regulator [Flavihumibacter rivuli]ULQ55117.1 MerR family transcriptional regulator [Flavihumibacter rivuli]